MSSDPRRAPDLSTSGPFPTVPQPDAVVEQRRTRRGGDALARREAERRLAAVVEGMSDAFLSLDANWRITYANREVCRLNGVTREALVGRDHWTQWPETVGSEVERQYRRAAAERVTVRFEHHYPEADTWHAISAYPAEGGGLAVFYRDITADKRAERERERAYAAAEAARRDAEAARAAAEEARARADEANAVKAQFLATMSHELRTPLNAIGGYAQLMELGLRGPVTPEQLQDLGRIQRSQHHLLGLVNSVLNYARIEAGRVHYEIVDVPLATTVAAVDALVAPQLRAKGLELALQAPDATLAARADAEKLRQIVLNLLTNATKFTPAGGRVTVSCREVDAATVAVRVADTGVGIPSDKLGAVFDPFVQVGRRLTSTEEGVGLGLAISRDLARGMGGDLAAESEVGIGSTFTLTLPRATGSP